MANQRYQDKRTAMALSCVINRLAAGYWAAKNRRDKDGNILYGSDEGLMQWYKDGHSFVHNFLNAFEKGRTA